MITQTLNRQRGPRARLLFAVLTVACVVMISPTVASAKQSNQRASFNASSGFNPKVDGFAFQNSASVPAQGTGLNLLIQLFGRKSICVNTNSSDECVPQQLAAQFANNVETQLAAGRCEGLTVLAAKLHADGGTPASVFSPEEINQKIDFWWATQMLPKVTAKSQASRALQPSQLIEEIKLGIVSGATSTLGMYFEGQGHTVLPITIQKKGHQVHVGVYDSNTPEMTQTLRINTKTQVWSYAPIDKDGKLIFSWSHTGSGALDVIPLSLRTPQQTDYFSRASIKE